MYRVAPAPCLTRGYFALPKARYITQFFTKKMFQKCSFYNGNGTLFMRTACTERSRSVGGKHNVCGMEIRHVFTSL